MSNYFLATTALEEFWNIGKTIVFLSDACLRHSRKSIWQNLDYKVLYNPLEEKKEFKKTYAYLNRFYERCLPLVSKALNAVHLCKKSDSYWRIVIGPWLLHYIYILYERYIALRAALSKYPGLDTVCLDRQDWVTPKDFRDFIMSSFSDIYNLQLYSQLFAGLGRDFPSMKWKHKDAGQDGASFPAGENAGLKKLFRNLIRQQARVIVKNAYFPPQHENKLLLLSGAKVYFDHEPYFNLPETGLDSRMRLKLSENLNFYPKEEFERIFSFLLPHALPKAYLEGHNCFLSASKKIKGSPKAIVSSESWYFDELFKVWAAECSEKGVKLIGIQHGANYGISAMLPHETHEIKITSRFYSWGWNDIKSSEIKPFPAPRLMDREKALFDGDNKDILLVVNCFPRYLYRFHDFRNYDNKEYFNWQFRFFRGLNDENKDNLRVRLYVEDYGCDCKLRWQDEYSRIKIEEPLKPFSKSLAECKLVVHDHLGSTYLESLVINKPTIMYWNPDVYEVREEAVSYFMELHECGILFYSPEEAATVVNNVSEDLKNWWFDERRQLSIRKFCDRFALFSPDAIGMWAKELSRL